ncbi:MAG: ADP-forming succinate--CoA ligase subunit beta [bacterium]
MKLHEYQAKSIFARFGIPVPAGEVAATAIEAREMAARIGKRVVIKAQVHVGGRGKAGGVKFASEPDQAHRVACEILSMSIKGLPVKKVLVGECLDVADEYYLGIVVDRKSQRPVVMVSAAGGVDIEDVARRTPEKIHKHFVDPARGLMAYEARDLAFGIIPDAKVALKAAAILMKLYTVFVSIDCSLAEINPLVRTSDGQVIALDAKITIDDNAVERRPEIEEMRDLGAESPYETKARERGLSYVKLDGSIGCIVNGAGLAMATMDMIKHYGGEPANFLDIGGSSSPEKVTAAMEIVLSDENVRVILFNIFGGITRCDDVARGIVEALRRIKVDVPVVVRLTGTNEEAARAILKEIAVVPVTAMDEGVMEAVRLVRGDA